MVDAENRIMAILATLSSPGSGVSLSTVRGHPAFADVDPIDINIVLNDLLVDDRLERVQLPSPFSSQVDGVLLTGKGWSWVKNNRSLLVGLIKSEDPLDTL